jgi:hypothetical protein
MTSVENRTRSAMDAITSQVDSAPPLSLPPPDTVAGRSRVPASRGRWGTRLVPAAAAAAVIAVAISLVVVRNIPNGHGVPQGRPVPASGSVPMYYADLVSTGSQQEVVVGNTFTGARLATVSVPRGSTFYAVTAAADDRTFVLAAEPSWSSRPVARTLYLLRIAPGTPTPARLTPLPFPVLQGGQLFAVALSGSGRQLAVGFRPAHAKAAPSSPTLLRIYSVATGKAERTWSTRDNSVFNGHLLSGSILTWVDNDRALAFSTRAPANTPAPESAQETMRLLDMSARGSDLMADSKVIWSVQGIWSQATGSARLSCAVTSLPPMITADGKTIVCAAIKVLFRRPSSAPERWTLAWLAYSTSAPNAARTLGELTVVASQASPAGVGVLWAGPAGSPLIGTWRGVTTPIDRPLVGMISGGKIRQLPTPPSAYIGGIAW